MYLITLLPTVEYFAAGFLGGLIGSMVGLGGGFVIVPFLLLGMAFLPAKVAGTSIVVVFVTAIISASQYARHHLIDWKLGSVLAGFSVPGAIIGAMLAGDISTGLFMEIFAVDLLLVASYMFFRPNRPLRITFSKHYKGKIRVKESADNPGGIVAYAINLPLAAMVFFPAGILAGLVGVGGGSIMVPGMLLILGMPAAMVAATSMMVIFLTRALRALCRPFLAM